MANVEYTLDIPVKAWSSRPNHLPGEGGALNAGYTPVDALARISNILGQHGLKYDVDFSWHKFEYGLEIKTNEDQYSMSQTVALTFKNESAMLTAKLAVESVKNV